jgi:polysaccharide export outer membrane protein
MPRIILAMTILICFSACQLNSIDLPSPPAESPVYRLDSGDKISIQVFGQPDFSGQFEVSADGLLSLVTGPLSARGRTLGDIAEEFRARLDREFIVNPRLTVEIVVYRPIFVLGEVNRAGGFPYAPGLRVQQAIALAGGFTRRAISDKVVVTRSSETGSQSYALGLGDFVFPGDTLNVQRRLF